MCPWDSISERPFTSSERAHGRAPSPKKTRQPPRTRDAKQQASMRTLRLLVNQTESWRALRGSRHNAAAAGGVTARHHSPVRPPPHLPRGCPTDVGRGCRGARAFEARGGMSAKEEAARVLAAARRGLPAAEVLGLDVASLGAEERRCGRRAQRLHALLGTGRWCLQSCRRAGAPSRAPWRGPQRRDARACLLTPFDVPRCPLRRAARERFRALALVLHPDRQSQSEASGASSALLGEAFAAARAAYEVLCEANEGAAGAAGGASGGSGAAGSGEGASSPDTGPRPESPRFQPDEASVRRARSSWGASNTATAENGGAWRGKPKKGAGGAAGRPRPVAAASPSAWLSDMGFAPGGGHAAVITRKAQPESRGGRGAWGVRRGPRSAPVAPVSVVAGGSGGKAKSSRTKSRPPLGAATNKRGWRFSSSSHPYARR